MNSDNTSLRQANTSSSEPLQATAEVLNKELSIKTQQLLQCSLRQEELSKTLEEVYNDLKKIQSSASEPFVLQQVLITIKKTLESPATEEGGNLLFRTHEDFLVRWVSQYPGLNTREQRYCIYLKAGLSNKEIAMRMNMETGSLKKMHTRMKYKMGLEPKVSLRELIQKG